MALGDGQRAATPGAPRRAVFLDKDGTLLENVPYNIKPELMRLSRGALEGAALLQSAGYLLFVISNQSGVARGLFPEEALTPVFARLNDLLAAGGIEATAHYYCPHHPQGVVPAYQQDCSCRKPSPGMILKAAQEHDLDLAVSWVVGDILDDVEAGRRAGCRTVLLDNGNETEWLMAPGRRPHMVAEDLLEAARLILAADSYVPATGEQR